MIIDVKKGNLGIVDVSCDKVITVFTQTKFQQLYTVSLGRSPSGSQEPRVQFGLYCEYLDE